jgi:hypothetical protein
VSGSGIKGRTNGRDRPIAYDCSQKAADFGKRARGLVVIWPAPGFRFVEVESVAVDRCGRTEPLFYFVMRNLNPESASGDDTY